MKTVDTKTTSDRFIIDFQKLGTPNVLALGHYNYKNAKERLKTHVHTGIIEICYLEKGTQHYSVNGEDFHLNGGELLVTYPDEPHGTSCYPEERGSLYWLLLEIPAKNAGILNLSPADTGIIINRLLNLPVRHFKGLPGIKNILSGIFRAYQTEIDPLRLIGINNNILTLLLTVIHSAERNGEKKVTAEIEYLCRHIRENLTEDFELEKLASMVHLSVSRFKHRFKAETGIPPKEYILREKINKAKVLLNDKSLSISSIAYDLGFYSSSYFATVFKRYTMLTPTEFRVSNGSN
jgi:AraC-like DNA-binding protein